MDDRAYQEPAQPELRQRREVELAVGTGRQRTDHAGHEIYREPEAMPAGQTVDQRRDAHGDAADDAALDACRVRMDFFGEAEAVAGHAGTQVFNVAVRLDRLRPSLG